MADRSNRKAFDEQTRLELLENDVTALEASDEELDKRLDRVNTILIGILISVTTSAIMLAINLIAGSGGTTPGG